MRDAVVLVFANKQVLQTFQQKFSRMRVFFPQQRKLMGSSAQISSGVCRCGSQEQVPEEGSGRFRRVPVCAGVSSGQRFRKVLEGSGVCWCGFRRKVPEGSGGFRCVLVWVPEEGSERFRRVRACAGVSSGGRFRKVPEDSGVCWYRFRRQVPEGSGGFRCVLV